MVKPFIIERFLAVATATLIVAALTLPAAFGEEAALGEAVSHNKQGMVYFKKGFYDHAPKKEGAEAERNYGLAVKEFRAAIARDPSFTDAHRNLARVYYVRKEFAGAAREYQRVTELAPGEIDAYVNLALSLIELKRLDEAIKALERAKGETSDPKALATLDTYISKVRADMGNGVR